LRAATAFFTMPADVKEQVPEIAASIRRRRKPPALFEMTYATLFTPFSFRRIFFQAMNVSSECRVLLTFSRWNSER